MQEDGKLELQLAWPQSKFQTSPEEGAGEKKRESLVIVAPMILKQNNILSKNKDHTYMCTCMHTVLFDHTASQKTKN